MNTLQAPPTATDRLRELLDLIDIHGHDGLPEVIAELGHSPRTFDGAEANYLLAVLTLRTRAALRDWEGR